MSQGSLLTPLQREFLKEFFARQTGQLFFLTGGTALAEYYFQHRFSEDIDLFTTDDAGLELARQEVPQISAQLEATLTSVLSTPTFQRFELVRADEPPLKLDFVRDVDFQFGQHRQFDGVIVDSLENMGANKVTAIFGRTASKDFVDLYFMLKAGEQLDNFISDAKEKDTGLTELWLAGMMRQVQNIRSLPEMIKPVEIEELKTFFLKLADDLFRKIKPTD